MVNLTFANPTYLWFLFGIPLLIFIHYVTIGKSKRKALKFANFEAIARVTGGETLTNNNALLIVRLIVVISVILAAAGTTLIYTGQTTDYDFVLAIDSSSSMTSDDIKPSRLEAVKEQTNKFISGISGANIGLVSFSGVTIVERELTDDLFDVSRAIKNINISLFGGTDLSSAIITSTNLLAGSERSKIIILLTDGRGNVGTPLDQAVKYANDNGIIIGTIGIGTDQGGEFNLGNNVTSILDENILRAIANATDGSYYKVNASSDLQDAYKNILQVGNKKIRTNLSIILLVIALVLLFIEWSLLNTRYKTIP